jgi:rieske iron-sulfur protein
MCKSDQPTISITSTDAELAAAMCQDPTRRALILTALATGACLASSRPSIAEEDLPGSNDHRMGESGIRRQGCVQMRLPQFGI